MKYEVRKSGKVYMSATDERCRYPPMTEASMQRAGYDIYVDGKRMKKIRENDLDRSSKKEK